MGNIFDYAMSALIEAKGRTEVQNEVDKAIDNLMHAAKTEESTRYAEEILNDKIGCLMNEEFELGIMCGFQLAVRMMQPVDLR